MQLNQQHKKLSDRAKIDSCSSQTLSKKGPTKHRKERQRP